MKDVLNSVQCGRKLKGYTCNCILYRIVPDEHRTLILRCAKCGGPKSFKKLNALNRRKETDHA